MPKIKKIISYSNNEKKKLFYYGFGVLLSSNLFKYTMKGGFKACSKDEVVRATNNWSEMILSETLLRIGMEQYLKAWYLHKGFLIHDYPKGNQIDISMNNITGIRKVLKNQNRTLDLYILAEETNLKKVVDKRVYKEFSKVINRIRIRGNIGAHYHVELVKIYDDNLKIVNYFHRRLLKLFPKLKKTLIKDAKKNKKIIQ